MKGSKKLNSFFERSLINWAVHGNTLLQILLVCLVVLVVISRVIPLEMQKRIVNESIALGDLNKLLLYCMIYLAAVVSAGILKFTINGIQTLIGERVMSSMRKSLYNHILTLPLSFFRRTQPGFVVSSLITELSTIGTFAGMAIAVPLTNLLTLVTIAGYLLWLNQKLALATLAIYPIVIFILPILQRKANIFNKTRVDLSRKTSSQIAESISGINEIHAHGAYLQEKAKFGSLIEELKKIRIRWTLFRHGIKTTNNFFISLGPFIVFILGGYLAIKGELALGALIAFLSAQEKLYDPWKELINFYQLYQDAAIRYRKTTDYFNIESEIVFASKVEEPPPLHGSLVVDNLTFRTDEGYLLLDNISFTLEKGQHLALVGVSGSGKSTLAKCIGNLIRYHKGSIKVDGYELNELSKNFIVNNIGFVPQQPFIFTGTVEDNLLYAHNAKYSGMNPPPQPSLDDKIEALQYAAFFVDTLRFGLDTTLLPGDVEFKAKVLRMRQSFHNNHYAALEKVIAPFDSGGSFALYLDDQPIINNIFYGRILSTRDEDQEKINHAVVHLLIEEDCLETVAQFGLLYNVGSEGVKLSGGQRQKLAIARVILKKPNFILFDEATSALDNSSQNRIENLRTTKWQGQKTVVAVVHRLDIIDTYDMIAVMKNGRIVEFGTYKELIAKNGFLHNLVAEKEQ